MGKVKYKNIEDFKRAYLEKYGTLDYDWSKAIWTDYKHDIILICPIHGEFTVSPNNLLSKRKGCSGCKGGVRKTSAYYIEKSRKVHGDKFDYNLVPEVKNNTEEVPIICKKCGRIFTQSFDKHTLGNGCPYCAGRYKTTEDFIKKAVEVHGDKYDYSQTEFKNNETKVTIICKKHGPFTQYPYHHLSGCGCNICKESRLEKYVSSWLSERNINFIPQYKNQTLLGKMSIDFYIPSQNMFIECQGKQHINLGGWGEKSFNEQYARDVKKRLIVSEQLYGNLYYLFSDYAFLDLAIRNYPEIYTISNSFIYLDDFIQI